MDALLKHITERLGGRAYCIVYENEILRVWPRDDKENATRHAAIHAFAAKHGLSASINDPGIRVKFRKL